MELKDKKFIKNTGKLPGFEPGRIPTALPIPDVYIDGWSNETGPIFGEYRGTDTLMRELKNGKLDTTIPNTKTPLIDKVGEAVVALPEAIGQVSQSFAYDDRDKIYNSARNVLRTRSGIGYTAKELPAAKNGKLPGYARGTLDSTLSTAAAGASVGSAFGPWGTAIGGAVGGLTGLIGGLWSNSKEARERAAAQERIGEENYAGALTADAIAMRQENALDYGLTKQGRLRGMKCGKLPGFVGGKRVQSAYGLVNAEPNAWTDGGELIINTKTGAQHMVPWSNKTDSYLSHVEPEDMIIPADKVKQMIGYKCGKLPKHYDGKWANVGAHLMSGVGGLSQYLQALNDKPYNPNTYAGNPYEGKALNDLYSLRANPYPILPSIYDAQAKGMYAIANSGGLSGGQRTLARLASTKNTQDSIAKMLLASQEQNNQYLAQAANASLNAGQAAAQRRMQANQFDLDYYSKAHAARQQGMQLGMYNMINSYQSYLKNLDKYNQFARMYKLYSDDLDVRRDAVKKGIV